MWARAGRGTQQQRRSISEKESGRWIEGMQRSEALLSPLTHVITIADREADIYELLACERREHSDYLIRIHHDRQVKENPEGEEQSLRQVLRSQERGGYFQLELRRTPRSQARETLMWVTRASVWLQVPNQHPEREKLRSVRVQVVWAIEEACEIDQRPVEWILVTSLPFGSFEQAQRVLWWYSYRWQIERYHYTLKSGCRVEHLQLESFDRLERAVACYAIVAIAVANLYRASDS